MNIKKVKKSIRVNDTNVYCFYCLRHFKAGEDCMIHIQNKIYNCLNITECMHRRESLDDMVLPILL